MPDTDRIRVMIVDDHPIVRSGLVTMLQAFNDLELVGEASSGEARHFLPVDLLVLKKVPQFLLKVAAVGQSRID